MYDRKPNNIERNERKHRKMNENKSSNIERRKPGKINERKPRNIERNEREPRNMNE